MGTPIQNPGYFGGPANDSENDQLNQLENSGAYGNPVPSPDPTPSPTPDDSGSVSSDDLGASGDDSDGGDQ
jgi:hypothetical protein